MKKHLAAIAGLLLLLTGFNTKAVPVVSNISATYHDGQIFIVWTNIPSADTGFYYVYKSKKKITSSNLKNATYVGRVTYNFGYDYRFNLVAIDGVTRYLVINDNPRTVLSTTQNVFVYTETAAGDTSFFAVTSAWGMTKINTHIAADSNATSGKVIGQLDPVKCYLEESGVPFAGAKQNETMDVYIHYGGNKSCLNYPAMANEGCLAFHWGITKEGPNSTGVACYLKFHPGGSGGNFISAQLTTVMTNTWKICFDDWIPAFGIDARTGDNTRWLGYSQYTDIYKINLDSPPPTTGIIKGYTFHRVDWEYEWILKNWPGAIDTNKIYLLGDSEGTGSVMLHSQVEPNRWAACISANPKFNLNAPQDYNSDCRYNTGASGRNSLNIYWGDHLVTNLPTDILISSGGTKYYNIYNVTDANYMMKQNKLIALPFMGAISGKNDNTTCWQEKPAFYDSVDYYSAGGYYFWDLREHGGDGYNEWPPLQNNQLQNHYFLNHSYPAISYCSIDGNPGDANVPTPPYYDGDSVGTIHGNVDWLDGTLIDSSNKWSLQIFITQKVCNSGLIVPATLPSYATATIALRRLQKFVNIPNKTKLCWSVTNKGVVVQSGTYTTKKQTIPITLKNVRIYADTSTFSIVYCSSQPSRLLMASKDVNAEITAFPNPCSENFLTVNVPDELDASAKILVYDVLGHLVMQSDIGTSYAESQTFKMNVTNFKPGIYYVNLIQDQTSETFNFIKSY